MDLLPTHAAYQLVCAPSRPAPGSTEKAVIIFLAGSTSTQSSAGALWQGWRESVAAGLRDLPVVLLDPYRADWDSTWRESEDDERFVNQVEWELEMQERADIVVVVFAPDTKAPISLLELGIHVGHVSESGVSEGSSKLIVVCSDKYWKMGNVKIVCKRYGIPCLNEVQDLEAALRMRVIELSRQTKES